MDDNNLVATTDACPHCQERRADSLMLSEDEDGFDMIECLSCGLKWYLGEVPMKYQDAREP